MRQWISHHKRCCGTARYVIGVAGVTFILERKRYTDPVIGLDISKGQSEGQAFLKKGQPYGKNFSFMHTQDELQEFFNVIKEVESRTGQSTTFMLESTGHYHSAVVQFLEEHDIFYIIVNPLISNQAKDSSLRKVKADAVDAYQLCELYYKEEFETYKNEA